MLLRRRRPRQAEWGRGKLVVLLAGLVAVCLILLGGLGLAVFYTLQPTDPDTTTTAIGRAPAASAVTSAVTSAEPDAQSKRDLLAARPMPTISLEESRPGPLSAQNPGVIVIPKSTRLGPANVPTGFGHTPQGALAQLAAIDQAALQSGSLPGVRAVIEEWAAAGGPTPQTWSGVKAMAEFLDAAGLSSGGSPSLAIVATPMMGLIKGTVGRDFVVACVDFEVDATLTQTQRVAAADCQRMVWDSGRWIIGPGPEPAPAPSTWPGTDAAIQVGYKDLRYG